MKPLKVINSYVYIVYECPTAFKLVKSGEGIKYKGGTIHGVYINQDEAEGKARKVIGKNQKNGYMCILKKPVLGKERSMWETWDA